MTYCTTQDMIKRFREEEIIQLTDHERTGNIDIDVLQRATQDATDEINGYLAGRYGLPLSVVPRVLTRLCCDIARYYLYDDAVTDQVNQRYEQAIKFLSAMAKGQVSLGLSQSGAKVNPVADATIHSAGNVFARDENGSASW